MLQAKGWLGYYLEDVNSQKRIDKPIALKWILYNLAVSHYYVSEKEVLKKDKKKKNPKKTKNPAVEWKRKQLRDICNKKDWQRERAGNKVYSQLTQHDGALSGGPVVKNPLCNAGGVGLILGWGTKLPQALEQLSPNTTNRQSVCHN